MKLQPAYSGAATEIQASQIADGVIPNAVRTGALFGGMTGTSYGSLLWRPSTVDAELAFTLKAGEPAAQDVLGNFGANLLRVHIAADGTLQLIEQSTVRATFADAASFDGVPRTYRVVLGQDSQALYVDGALSGTASGVFSHETAAMSTYRIGAAATSVAGVDGTLYDVRLIDPADDTNTAYFPLDKIDDSGNFANEHPGSTVADATVTGFVGFALVQGLDGGKPVRAIPDEWSQLATVEIGGNDTDTPFSVANERDNDMRVRLQAGSTEQYRCYLDWRDPADGSNQWLMGVNAGNAFILYDTESTGHRFFFNSNDGTGLAGTSAICSVGTGAVRINNHSDGGSGTGGLRVFAGGANFAEEWATFDGDANMLRGNPSSIGLLLKASDTAVESQVFRVGLRHHTASENPAAIFLAQCTGGISTLDIGGGTGAMNAMREIRLYAADSTTTPTGTLVGKVSNRGFLVDPSGASLQDSSSALEVSSTTKGFLPPRMTTAQRDAIGTPAEGLTVWNTTTKALESYDGTAWA